MNKKRMVSYSIILALLILSLLFGTFTLIISETYKRNTVTFKIGSPGAYCKVEGQYFLGQKALKDNQPTLTYLDTYTEVDEYGKYGKTLNAWNVGKKSFAVAEDENGVATDEDINIMVFKIKITSLTDGESLRVNLSGVACCDVDDEDSNYFSTKIVFQYNGGEEIVKYSNEDDATLEQKQNFNSTARVVNDINDETYFTGTMDITITFKRRTKTASFEQKNNFNFEICAD